MQHCGSTLYRKWWGLWKTKKCIHPDCRNYFLREDKKDEPPEESSADIIRRLMEAE